MEQEQEQQNLNQESVAEQPSVEQPVQPPEQPKSKKLIIIISIVAVLLIAGCVSAYYFYGDEIKEKIPFLKSEKVEMDELVSDTFEKETEEISAVEKTPESEPPQTHNREKIENFVSIENGKVSFRENCPITDSYRSHAVCVIWTFNEEEMKIEGPGEAYLINLIDGSAEKIVLPSDEIFGALIRGDYILFRANTQKPVYLGGSYTSASDLYLYKISTGEINKIFSEIGLTGGGMDENYVINTVVEGEKDTGTTNKVYKYDIKSGETNLLFNLPKDKIGIPAHGRDIEDGKFIWIARIPANGYGMNYEIHDYNLDEEKDKVLTTLGYMGEVSMASDAKHIAWTSTDTGYSDANEDIFYMNFNDEKIHRLTNTPDINEGVVSVGVDKIIYAESGGFKCDTPTDEKSYLFMYRISTGETDKILGPSIRPTASFMDRLLIVKDACNRRDLGYGIYYSQ